MNSSEQQLVMGLGEDPFQEGQQPCTWSPPPKSEEWEHQGPLLFPFQRTGTHTVSRPLGWAAGRAQHGGAPQFEAGLLWLVMQIAPEVLL